MKSKFGVQIFTIGIVNLMIDVDTFIIQNFTIALTFVSIYCSIYIQQKSKIEFSTKKVIAVAVIIQIFFHLFLLCIYFWNFVLNTISVFVLSFNQFVIRCCNAFGGFGKVLSDIFESVVNESTIYPESALEVISSEQFALYLTSIVPWLVILFLVLCLKIETTVLTTLGIAILILLLVLLLAYPWSLLLLVIVNLKKAPEFTVFVGAFNAFIQLLIGGNIIRKLL